MNKSKPIYLWKSLSKGLKSGIGNHKWEVGEWYKVKGNLSMCDNGFHASKNIIDAMQYINMECLAKVQVKGQHLHQEDKQCWEEMRVVRAWIWQKEDSVRLAIYAASLVLENYEDKYPGDDSPRKAIEAARNYLKTKNKSAARSAARSAAESVAWSAAESAVWSAARSAAESAAWSAARSAAESAAWSAAESAAGPAAWSAARSAKSAWSAARPATRSASKLKCHNWINRRIPKLKEIP